MPAIETSSVNDTNFDWGMVFIWQWIRRRGFLVGTAPVVHTSY
jgi:hypothetical protein